MAASLDLHGRERPRDEQPARSGAGEAASRKTSPYVVRALEVANAARARAARIRGDGARPRSADAASRPAGPPARGPEAGAGRRAHPAREPLRPPAPGAPAAPSSARADADRIDTRPDFRRTTDTPAAQQPRGAATGVPPDAPQIDRLARLRRAIKKLTSTSLDGASPVRSHRRSTAGPVADAGAAPDDADATADAAAAGPAASSGREVPPWLRRPAPARGPGPGPEPGNAQHPSSEPPLEAPGPAVEASAAPAVADPGPRRSRTRAMALLLRRGGALLSTVALRSLATTYGAARETAMFAAGVATGLMLLSALGDDRVGMVARATWLMQPPHTSTIERTLQIAPAPLAATNASLEGAGNPAVEEAREVPLPAPPRPQVVRPAGAVHGAAHPAASGPDAGEARVAAAAPAPRR